MLGVLVGKGQEPGKDQGTDAKDDGVGGNVNKGISVEQRLSVLVAKVNAALILIFPSSEMYGQE